MFSPKGAVGNHMPHFKARYNDTTLSGQQRHRCSFRIKYFYCSYKKRCIAIVLSSLEKSQYGSNPQKLLITATYRMLYVYMLNMCISHFTPSRAVWNSSLFRKRKLQCYYNLAVSKCVWAISSCLEQSKNSSLFRTKKGIALSIQFVITWKQFL